MENSTKYFLATLALFAIVSGVFYYHSNRQTDTLREEMLNEIARLGQNTDQRLNEVNTRMLGIQDALVHQGDQFSKAILASDSQITQVAHAVQKLGGALADELARVEQESKEGLGQLEQKLVQVNVRSKDFSDIIEAALKATISVRTDKGYGSGVIIDKGNYAVTNYHVIDGIKSGAVLTYDREVHKIRIVDYDKKLDIAVIQVQTEKEYPLLRFGNSDIIKAGNKVIALGNPGGLDFTVTEGIVSSVDRETKDNVEVFQIDVPINPGNSGGPLVNVLGRVIGINTAKLSGFEGIGFSIKSNQVEPVASAIISRDKTALSSE